MLVRFLPLFLFLSALAGDKVIAENLILISVDTLRADRLSCYGYKGNTTGNIDRWAREGFLFERAYSEYPLTLPAHSSMLTGTYPLRHGVRENVGYRLADSARTVAEILREQGYGTAGFVGSYVMGGEFGLAQGFDHYDDEFPVPIESVMSATAIQRPAGEVTRLFMNWVAGNRPDRFFAFIHFYDPHTPRPLGYDYEVSQVDRSLGVLSQFLSENGLLQKTHVILTSDHGESLGEHGESGHGFFLYDSTIHVPFIVRLAGGTGQGRIESPVSLADVVPTILDLLGLAIPHDMQGRSVLPMIQGEDTAAGPVYAETRIPNLHFGWAPLRSIRDGQYKYIDAPDPELYDLKKDPAELINLCGEFASIGMQYRRLLDSFVGKWPDRESERAGPGQVDPEALERLAALGYVRHGGTGQASLIDPKERIGAFEEYHAILNLLPEGTVTNQTLQRLDQLEIEAPEMRGVSFLRAWTCEILGDDETALSNYQVALQEDSTNPLARARYARLLARRGDLGRAEEQFEILLRLDPEDYKSRNNLAGLFHMTGRTAEAAAELEKVTSQRPSYPAAWQNLGRLYLAAGDYVRAENSCRRFIALTPANPAGHSLLSQALAGQGRQEEAAKEAAEARRLNSGPVRP